MSQSNLSKLKVLVVLPSTVIGGAETRMFNLLRGMKTIDTVLLTQAAISGFYEPLAIGIHQFDNYGCHAPYACTSLKNILKYARAVQCVAKRERPNLLLGWMNNGTVYVNAAKQLFCLNVLSIGTVLGNLSAYFESIHRRPSFREKVIIRYCSAGANGIIVPSFGVKADLVNHYWADSEKISVIYNGIDIERVRRFANDAVSLEKRGPWIVTACRLGEQKDFSTLLTAFKKVREKRCAKLLLVGDGEKRVAVERIVSDLQLEGEVILTGYQKNPFPYIANADVFVLSSHYEGFGNVLVEAMALGIPVVSTDCPSGPGEIIEQGVNGLLTPVGDTEALATAVLGLLEDADWRDRIAQQALQRAEVFSVERMVDGFATYLADKAM